MSDLQIMLIGIGGLIIVAVIIINWWQERRFHQQINRSFSALESDALLDEPKIDASKLDVAHFASPEFDTSKVDTTSGRDAFNDSEIDHFTFVGTPENSAQQPYNATFNSPQDHSKNQAPKPDHADRYAPLTTHGAMQDSAIDPQLDPQLDSPLDAAETPNNAEFLQNSDTLYQDLSSRHLSAKVNNNSKDQAAKDFVVKDDAAIDGHKPTVEAQEKPAQHDDIKAIFNEAFNQPNKIANTSESVPLAQTEVQQTSATALKSNQLPADTESSHDNNQIATDIVELSLPAMLHAQIDITAVLYLAAETSISQLNNALSGLLDDFDKPVFVHVLTAQSDTYQQWALLKDVINNEQNLSQKVSRVACSLQLADRAGPVARNVLNRFQLAVETLGLDINAHVEWQSAGDILAAAIALDTFCVEVDKTLGFHLVHGENGAFTGTKLRGLAEAQGFTLDSDGTFKYFINLEKPSENHEKTPVLFIMFNRDNHPFSPEMLRNSVVKGITFQLEIPHITPSSEAFTQMVQVAKQMEASLNAVLVDANNKVLSDTQIEKIRHQLKVIHATMSVRGIIPGSDCALRLFS